MPIRFTVDVVGSTSTLISERIEEAGLSAPPPLAGILLVPGLLSDTLVLTSPTVTERDRLAAERLGRWSFIRNSPLAGETVANFGQQVLKAGSGLAPRNPDEVVATDLKLYEAGGFSFAIAQAEVTDLVEAPTALRGSFDPSHLELPREVPAWVRAPRSVGRTTLPLNNRSLFHARESFFRRAGPVRRHWRPRPAQDLSRAA